MMIDATTKDGRTKMPWTLGRKTMGRKPLGRKTVGRKTVGERRWDGELLVDSGRYRTEPHSDYCYLAYS